MASISFAVKPSQALGTPFLVAVLLSMMLLLIGRNQAVASTPRTLSAALEILTDEVEKRFEPSDLKLEFIHATYSGLNRRYDAQFRFSDRIIRGRVLPDGKLSLNERIERNNERAAVWQNAPAIESLVDLDKLLAESEKKVRADGYDPTGVALLKFNHQRNKNISEGWLAKTQVLFEVKDQQKARVVEFHQNKFISHKAGTLLQIKLPVIRPPQVKKPEVDPLELDIPELRTPGIEVYRTKNGETVIRLQGSILFAFDDDQPLPDSLPIIRRIAKLLIDEQPTQVRIEGHTDSWGTPQYNDDLSRRRAKTIAQQLVAAGVTESVMEIYGYGESRPIAAELNTDGSNNAEGRQRNRRVEFIYKK